MTIETPFGALHAVVNSDGALTALEFGDAHGNVSSGGASRAGSGAASGGAAEIARQLGEYFAGARQTFGIALAPAGTDFQKRVWAELMRIPYGETISYAELARRVGSPGAARAVGRANATNPIAIVTPCHRVIGADGTLTGYAYGVDLKRQLLEFEKSHTNQRAHEASHFGAEALL